MTTCHMHGGIRILLKWREPIMTFFFFFFVAKKTKISKDEKSSHR